MRPLQLLCFAVFLQSCSILRTPNTAGDPKNASTFGYQPIDPLPIVGLFDRNDSTMINGSPRTITERVLRALPDETMRLATRQTDIDANVSFSSAKLGGAGHNYEIIIDYIKFDTKPLKIKWNGDQSKTLLNDEKDFTVISDKSPDIPDAVIPAYIGIGLRLTATINVISGSVDLGSLFAIGAAAQAKKLTGSMIIQTLGITGDAITPLIPLPSEISPSTIQNSILALSNIKAKISEENVIINPRIVGFYNVLGGGGKTVNKIISSLLMSKPTLEIP